MRVLQIISHYVPAYRFGGPLQAAHSLGLALTKLGHDVRVCCTNLETMETVLAVPKDEPVVVDGVTVFYESVLLSLRWGFSPKLARRIWQELPHADLVLVHAHFQFANWIGALLSRIRRRPYVTFAHCSLREVALRGSSYWAKRIYLRALESGNMRKALFIAFNAEEEMADSLFRECGLIIPNGVDPDAFEPLPARGQFRSKHSMLENNICFTFLGRLDTTQKAVDQIVTAFSKLAIKHDNVRLILAGPSEGGDIVQIKHAIARHQLQEKVLMPGLLGVADKVSLLRDSDVFLLPSHYEGLSISLLEAMYMELPVIVSDNAGLQKQVARSGCGLVVRPLAPSIAEAMGTMMDATLRVTMGTRGRDLICRDHLWENIAVRLLEEVHSRAPFVLSGAR